MHRSPVVVLGAIWIPRIYRKLRLTKNGKKMVWSIFFLSFFFFESTENACYYKITTNTFFPSALIILLDN